MKIFLAASIACLPLLVAGAEPKGKRSSKGPRKTVPGRYPAIIQLDLPTERTAASGQPNRLITSDLGGREIQFFQTANSAGLRQLSLANLAKEKGLSDQLQTVASTLLITQAEENKQVARIAALKGVGLAPAAKPLTPEFDGLAGAKLEKAWVEHLVAANQQAVDAFQIGVQASDPDIRSFAEKLLPLEQSKLQVANRLAGNAALNKPEIIDPVIEPAPVPPSAPQEPPNSAESSGAAPSAAVREPATGEQTAASPKPNSTPEAKPETPKAKAESAKPAKAKPTPKTTGTSSSKRRIKDQPASRKTTPAKKDAAPIGLVQWLRGKRRAPETGKRPPAIASGPRSFLKPFWKRSATARD